MKLRTIVCALAAAIGGCTTAPKATLELGVWAVGEMHALTDRSPRIEDAYLVEPSGSVRLDGACNETLAFQLVVDAAQPVRNLRIAAGDLRGPDRTVIPAAGIRLMRQMPVSVTEYPAWYLRLAQQPPAPADFYDALVPIDSPRGGQPYDLAQGNRLALWVDVAIPRNAVAGAYTGRLLLTAEGYADKSLGVSLTVHDFVLPDERPIAAAGGFDHQTLLSALMPGWPGGERRHLDRSDPQVRQGLVLMRQLMKLAHEHRLDLFDTRLAPVLKRDAQGDIKLDWTDYDAIVTPYLTGGAFEDGVAVAAWPLPVCQDWPDPSAGSTPEAHANLVAETARQCAEHLGARLGHQGQLFAWPYRGAVDEQAYQRHIALAQAIRRGAPATPLMTHLPPWLPPEALWRIPGEFRHLADIAAPAGEWFKPDAPLVPQVRMGLSGLWLSTGRAPYVPALDVAASPCDGRALAWLAMKYDTPGLFIPDVLDWRTLGPAAESSRSGTLASTRLFYPGAIAGADGVLPSLRLKRLRRGLQDLAYLHLLTHRDAGDVAQAVTAVLVRYAAQDGVGDHYLDPRADGWSRDPRAWELARALLAQEALAAIRPGEAPSRELLARRVAWQGYVQASRGVEVEQVRCRVLAGQDKSLMAALSLDLFNGSPQPARVEAVLQALDESWSALEPQGRSMDLAPLSRKTLVLRASGAAVPQSVDGKLPLKVRLTQAGQSDRTIDTPAPLLLAPSVQKAPVIDGAIEDFPSRRTGTAGAFRLLGARGAVGNGLASRQTMALAAHDGRNLYLAFYCEEPAPESMVIKPANTVQYDQLMACGEDLVEVLLDPGQTAQGPSDLYHIVIKPNGAFVAQRGVRCDPPLGRHEPWPADIRLAVGKTAKAWRVELEIPLAALGPGAKKPLWGVNFMRFATQGGESSSWAGAQRHYYDPRNLGTMLLVP
jgi:hypothetical protein